MRILSCYSNFSGHINACWRALDARDDVELRIIAFEPDKPIAPFQPELLEGLNFTLIPRFHDDNKARVRAIVDEFEPDAVFIAGMAFDYYRSLAEDRYAGARYYTGMDTQLKRTWKQRAAKLRFRKFFQNLDGAIGASERTYQLLRWYGIPEGHIRRGYCGFDEAVFAHAAETRSASHWPRAFVSIGRAVDVKGIDLLIDAYTRYRDDVDDPWSLIYCGTGPLADRLQATEGVDFRGFVQPSALPGVLAEAGAFLLCSLYEPWGVVIAEAGGAGLPLACTEACAASIDLVSDRYNGMKLQTGSRESIEEAMRYFHNNEQLLPVMGARSRQLASVYSAEMWAERIVRMCQIGA